MPGIVGLITPMPREQATAELRQMLGTLCHEEFYVTGTWIDSSMGVYVGWVARKGSLSDGMPLQNERGDAVLVFSGEDFSDPQDIKQLARRGHGVRGAGPDYLVHLYEEDPRFPAGLNGRFHGLLIDRRIGAAMLFNDRYGMHRIYCHQSPDAFYFSAEAKAILTVRPELRTIDPRAMGEFVSCGCTLEGRTLFQGISLLPGGSKWTFRKGSLEKKETYFQPSEWESEGPLEPEAFYQELRRAFSANLPRYFEEAERVAMSLTGGLDTRMILACRRPEPGSLPCYTFGSMYRENHDVRVARLVAQACGQSFEEIKTGQEFLQRFPYFAERAVYLSDGCLDVSRAPDLYVNERARQIAPVRMTGNYGGEILRKVRTFQPSDPPAGLFAPDFLLHVAQARQTFDEISRGNPVSFAAFKQLPWNHYGVMALEETQLSMRAPFLDNDLIRAAVRAPEAALASDDVCLRLIGDGNEDLLAIPTDRGVAGNRGRLLGAASRAILEFSFKAEYAYDMGMPQSIARVDHIFSALHLERLFLGRHKVFHFRLWYRDYLARYVRDVLLDSRSLSRPYVEKKAISEMVEGHLKGNRNFTNQIHKLLSLELVHRLFVDTPAVEISQPHASVSAIA
jgi:asparagine synthase (glutamine-hydrolysing)